MNDSYSVPYFVIKNRLNPDVAHQYDLKYGGFKKYEDSFFEIIDGEHCIKSDYYDLVKRAPFDTVGVVFVVENDASIASRRYQETYICQTPLCYAYEDLLRLFEEKIPKVRNRNSSQAFFEPLIPKICAQYLILLALIESTMVNGQKNIALTITSKSLKMNYSHNPNACNKEILSIKEEYFKTFDVDIKTIIDGFNSYSKRHRTKIRLSFFNGSKTLEVLYNVRATTFKKYSIADDQIGLLTKAEYDIYTFIKDRGGASLRLIAEEFGYQSTRIVKYHVDKLIKLNLVQRVGADKSHACFYRAV